MNLDELELELRKLPGVLWAGFNRSRDHLLVQLHVMGPTQPGIAAKATRLATRHADCPVAVEIIRWESISNAATGESQPAGNSAGPGTNETATEPDAVVEPTEGANETTESVEEPVEPVDRVEELPGGREPRPSGREHRLELLSVLTRPDIDELEVHLSNGRARTIGRSPLSQGLLGAVDATVEAIRGFTHAVSFSPAWVRTIETTADRRFIVAVALVSSDHEHCYGVAGWHSPVDAAARATLHALNRKLSLVLGNDKGHDPS